MKIFKYKVAHNFYYKNLIDEKKNQKMRLEKEAKHVLQIIGGQEQIKCLKIPIVL